MPDKTAQAEKHNSTRPRVITSEMRYKRLKAMMRKPHGPISAIKSVIRDGDTR
jgi:hypothetical protein